MTISSLIAVLASFLAIFFGIIDFFRGYLKDFPVIKYIYPENWHKYIQIYLFTDVKLEDAGCQHVSIQAKQVDMESKLIYQIPFKICIPRSNEKLAKFIRADIKFSTGEGTDLRIMEYNHKELDQTITLNQESLFSGYQGRYFLKVTRNYDGVAIQINVESVIFTKSKEPSRKTSWVTKSNIKINGLESNSMELKI